MLNLRKYNLIRTAIPLQMDHSLRAMNKMDQAKDILYQMLERGYDHWVLTFSGGKDSTSALIIALEAALERINSVRRIDIVYSDTTIEIPSIRQFAIDFLKELHKSEKLNSLKLFSHVIKPPIDQRYWVRLIGYGYPPPHQKFRWCTHRLKIYPVEKKLQKYILPNRTLIITGVRFGESQDRNNRLILSCSRGGECGQGLWFKYSERLKAGYLAPLIDWTSCDVWDFVDFVAPTLGYEVDMLSKIYNGHDTRFGCWTCTVVKQDRAMERTIAQPEWAHLRPLAEFRNYIWQSTRERSTRRLRDNGMPGRLRVNIRKKLLEKLLSIQSDMGIQLIDNKEIEAIKGIWENK